MEFDLTAFVTGNPLGNTAGLMDSDKTARNTAFFNACRQGFLAEAQSLLESGADLNTDRTGITALLSAVVGRHRDVALWLLDSGAEANCHNEYGWSGLHEAIRQNDVELTRAFLDKGALITRQPKRSGETPLMVACKQGNEEIGRMLLSKGANAKALDNGRNTALHYAAANGEAGL